MFFIADFKTRFKRAFIVLLFLIFIIIFSKNQNGITINYDSRLTASFAVPDNTAFFVVATPEKEYFITGIDDILEIIDTLNFVGNLYDFEGKFDYSMVLSCCNINQISESNILIKNNYIVNGDKVFELGFNLENYIKSFCLKY